MFRFLIQKIATSESLTIFSLACLTVEFLALEVLPFFSPQVLHHIDTQCDSGVESYPNAVKAVEETFRVLKPGGLLMIDMHSEEQAAKGYWFYSLVPKAAAKFKRKVIPEGLMFDALRDKGTVIPRVS